MSTDTRKLLQTRIAVDIRGRGSSLTRWRSAVRVHQGLPTETPHAAQVSKTPSTTVSSPEPRIRSAPACAIGCITSAWPPEDNLIRELLSSSEDETLISEVQPLTSVVQPLAADVEPHGSEEEPLAPEVQPLGAEEQPLGAEEQPLDAEVHPLARRGSTSEIRGKASGESATACRPPCHVPVRSLRRGLCRTGTRQ